MADFRRALLSIARILNSTAVHGRRNAPTSTIRSESLYRPFVGSFSRFYSSNQSLNIDLSDEECKRRLFNRLLYRSRQRGFLELDLILGKWVEEHIRSMDENGINSLVDVLDLVSIQLLESWMVSTDFLKRKWLEWVDSNWAEHTPMENPDLWKWLTDQEQPPEAINMNPVFSALREKVMNNLNNHAAPETRAALGQPWVRGWDDFKKGRDVPISGN